MHFTRRMLCSPFLASKEADLCEKCDHLLDFEENWELFRFCWRYLDVYTLFPFPFPRRVLCTPVSSSKVADLCEKCDHVLDFDDKLWVISLLLEIFRRLNDISIGFYTPHSMYAVFRVETSPTVRNMRTYTRPCRKRGVISLLLEVLPRLHAISIAFHFPNAMYASCIVERSRPVRKMRSCTRFWRQTVSYFAFVGDISKFKRCFHRILHAECYARRL